MRDGQGAVDVEFLNEHWIEEDEKERISRVEMLDEIEELNMLAKHYCVAWGWRDSPTGQSGVWDNWKELKNQPEDGA